MKKYITLIICAFLFVVCLCSVVSQVSAVINVDGVIDAVTKNQHELAKPENAGTNYSDWYALALSRLPDSGFDGLNYLAALNHKVQLMYDAEEFSKPTDFHRMALVIGALGGDPTKAGDRGDIDLIDISVFNCIPVNGGRLERQGLNAFIWALICADSKLYQPKKDAFYSREELITHIIDAQLDDGGFDVLGKKTDVDITAMALQALAPYYNTDGPGSGNLSGSKINRAVDKAIACLKVQQLPTAGFGGWGYECAESTAQVIIALTALGRNFENDIGFTKISTSGDRKTVTMIDALLTFNYGDYFINPSSGWHVRNEITTSQALCALAAYKLAISPNPSTIKKALYDLTGVETVVCTFEQEDLAACNNLPQKPDTSHYAQAVTLLYKATRSEGVSASVIDGILAKITYIDGIFSEINSILEAIDKLPELNKIDLSDRNAIKAIEKRLNDLAENDRGLAGEDLLTPYLNKLRSVYIVSAFYVFLFIIAVAGITYFSVRLAKKFLKKEE